MDDDARMHCPFCGWVEQEGDPCIKLDIQPEGVTFTVYCLGCGERISEWFATNAEMAQERIH